MKKYVVFLMFIVGINLGFAQQNEFFKEAKETYDKKEIVLSEEYQKQSDSVGDSRRGLSRLKSKYEKSLKKN